MGNYMKARLEKLQEKHPIIGALLRDCATLSKPLTNVHRIFRRRARIRPVPGRRAGTQQRDPRASGTGTRLIRPRTLPAARSRPQSQEINAIVAEMKEKGVLLGTDGPFHNVIKIKPPLVIAKRDVDLFVDALDACIANLSLPSPSVSQARL